MRAVDTNILARFLLDDDEAQTAAARVLLKKGVFIANSVLLETVWLLQSRYNQRPVDIAHALQTILLMPEMQVTKPALLNWALSRYANGADFADMLHLVESEGHDALVTFDKKMAKQAGNNPPLPVEVIKIDDIT
ncbi:MAG: type II toxin-antitoxin system VapC family toxin [Sphingorhabdus sp.]